MNNSLWIESTKNTNYPTLEGNLSTDVCIIGAGITGVVTAYLLNKAGLDVTIVDRQNVCMGVTANTTGKITSQHGLFYTYLINTFGKDFAKNYLYANENGLQLAKNIITSENIECDYEEQDSFVYTISNNEVNKIIEETNNVISLGFAAEFVKDSPLPFDIAGAIKFPNQAQFNSRKYVLSILDKLNNSGIKIFENTKVSDIKFENNIYTTVCNNYEINSKYVVMASHYPIKDFPGFYFFKMYQSKSYIIAVDTKTDLFSGMYITSTQPTCSLRTSIFNNKRVLLVAGGDHKTGANDVPLDTKYDDLFNFIKQYYPNSEIMYSWSTEDCISLDKVPYIGKFSNLMPNLYIATGFKKWGMTTSHIAAQIIRDNILNKPNKYNDIFSSTRFNPIGNSKEFGNMLKQTAYSLVINKVTSPTEDFSNLEFDSGGVVNYNGTKLGIYKDKDGKLYAVKPYCKHLGCELSWNNLDKTWDCPCHGSRYDYTGKLLNEPSKKDLDIVDLSDK